MSKTKKEEGVVLNISIDYKRSKEAVERTSNAELTVEYINYSLINSYGQGLEGQMRRVVGRLQRKLDDALDSKRYKVPLETAEVDLLKKSFDKAKVNPSFVKYYIILEEIIEKL